MADTYNWGNADDRDRFVFHLKSRVVGECVIGIRADHNSFEFHMENGSMIRVESKDFSVIMEMPEQSKIVQSTTIQ